MTGVDWPAALLGAAIAFGGQYVFNLHTRRLARRDALRSALNELDANDQVARHNTEHGQHHFAHLIIRDYRTASVERVLFSGTFEPGRETTTAGSAYLDQLEHINGVSARFRAEPANTALGAAVWRYSSGQLDPDQDRGARSIPEVAQEFRTAVLGELQRFP